MRRNGHYRRGLLVGEGLITIQVPQIECKGCGKAIQIEWGVFERRSRYWIGMDKEVTELYMRGFAIGRWQKYSPSACNPVYLP